MDIQELQSHLLALVLEFDSICRKHNIQYTLHGGSLLGAVREKGFIPWDDDIDVAMTRDEYEKLNKIIKQENGVFFIRGNIKKQFCKKDCPAEWVDIFICDYIKPTGLAFKIKELLLTIIDIMSRDKNSAKLSNVSKYNINKQIAFKILFYVGQIIPKTAKTYCYTFISKKCFLGNKMYMFRSNDQLSGRMKFFPAKWMEEYIDVTFTSSKLTVTQKYHDLLISCYGENYMIPIKDDRNQNVHKIVRSNENCL